MTTKRRSGPPASSFEALGHLAVTNVLAPTAVARRKLKLLVLGTTGMSEYELADDGDHAVGRSPNAEIYIDSASVSRAHAVLSCADGEVRVRDLKSTNGTFINGNRLGEEPAVVKADDALRFGDIVAQVRWATPTPARRPRALSADAFATRAAEEAERCVRFGSSMAVIAIAADGPSDGLNDTVADTLRAVDALAARPGGRVDVLLIESPPDDAAHTAARIVEALGRAGYRARAGLACFPDGSPSPEACILGAQVALHGAAEGGVGRAGEGARTFRVGGREVVVADPAMVRLYGVVDRVAPTAVPLLVIGETGTGKEILVEAVHANGRPGKPLVRVNCAAMPETLLESELFGHEKGAFSGADQPKLGLIRAAHGGTLLLDEIGEMPLALQSKLLRVLEDFRVRPVGSTVEHTVDTRFVAATNRDLLDEAEQGRFRKDLYYRLSGVVLRIPPLRERPREIPMLAERFASEAAERIGLPPVTFTEAALQALRRHDWPGNIRELRNTLSSAVMTSGTSSIDVEHLPPELAGAVDAPEPAPQAEPTSSLDDDLRAFERQRILEALEACGGNQTQAAARLQMPRRTLVAKLRAHGIRRAR
jgi:DNA-binding NtrC family response regulator